MPHPKEMGLEMAADGGLDHDTEFHVRAEAASLDRSRCEADGPLTVGGYGKLAIAPFSPPWRFVLRAEPRCWLTGLFFLRRRKPGPALLQLWSADKERNLPGQINRIAIRPRQLGHGAPANLDRADGRKRDQTSRCR
jgi:hypothetical protein